MGLNSTVNQMCACLRAANKLEIAARMVLLSSIKLLPHNLEMLDAAVNNYSEELNKLTTEKKPEEEIETKNL